MPRTILIRRCISMSATTVWRASYNYIYSTDIVTQCNASVRSYLSYAPCDKTLPLCLKIKYKDKKYNVVNKHPILESFDVFYVRDLSRPDHLQVSSFCIRLTQIQILH